MAFRLQKILVASLLLPTAATAQPSNHATDTLAVQAVLSQYKAATEKLDGAGTERLFTPDSRIFETGGSEETYANYLSHHLRPELAAFKSFKFSDYKVDVRFEGPIALAPKPIATGSSPRLEMSRSGSVPRRACSRRSAARGKSSACTIAAAAPRDPDRRICHIPRSLGVLIAGQRPTRHPLSSNSANARHGCLPSLANALERRARTTFNVDSAATPVSADCGAN